MYYFTLPLLLQDLEGDTDATMGEEANSLVEAQDRPQQQQQQPKKEQQQQQPQTQQPPSSPEEKKETAKDGI